MNDEELTIFALKAFGEAPPGFSPLTEDGDALRLAVKCEIALHHFSDSCAAAMGARFYSEPHGSDPCASTRRAIVRAAAGLGKSMR